MKINNPSPAPAISNGVQVTRALTDVSGAVATTGIGFKPTRLDIAGNVASTTIRCIGYVDSNLAVASIWDDALTGHDSNAYLYFSLGTGDFQLCNTVTFDNDGFTLTWAKTGNPTGTAKLNIIASK